jgi:hypothetical protein
MKKALTIFQHKHRYQQDQPFLHTPTKYGTHKQYAKVDSTAPLLDKKGKKFIQKVCGKFLFYSRTVNSTILVPLSAIASQSARPTKDTLEDTKQLFDYLATQKEAVLIYKCSAMKFAVNSDASYLSKQQACSHAGGHFFLSFDEAIPRNTGAILNIARIIKHVMLSATEAELAALYIMAREAVYIHIILEEMGHKEPPTPIQTDNAMADASKTEKCNPNAQRQWTCVSIDYAAGNANNNSNFIAAQAKQIMPTIGQNTTLLLIMSKLQRISGRCSCISTIMLHLQGCDDHTLPTL